MTNAAPKVARRIDVQLCTLSWGIPILSCNANGMIGTITPKRNMSVKIENETVRMMKNLDDLCCRARGGLEDEEACSWL